MKNKSRVHWWEARWVVHWVGDNSWVTKVLLIRLFMLAYNNTPVFVQAPGVWPGDSIECDLSWCIDNRDVLLRFVDWVHF